MMKILIIGTGILGDKVSEYFHKRNVDVTSSYYMHKINREWNVIHLDITDKEEVSKIKNKHDVIILTSAYTHVDNCEIDKEQAYKVNVEGVKNVAQMLSKEKLIYISTDYVFNGIKGNYRENDKTDSINYYGKTKLFGENIVKKYDNYTIARVSMNYGSNKNSFVTWVVEKLKNNEEIKLLTDNISSPTYNVNCAEALDALINNDEIGLFHASGSERINKYEFGLKIAKIFRLNRKLIKPIRQEELNLVAKRPEDSSLNVEKISKYIKMNNIEEGLQRIIKEKKLKIS